MFLAESNIPNKILGKILFGLFQVESCLQNNDNFFL